MERALSRACLLSLVRVFSLSCVSSLSRACLLSLVRVFSLSCVSSLSRACLLSRARLTRVLTERLLRKLFSVMLLTGNGTFEPFTV